MLGLVSLQTYVSVHGRCSKASASFLVIKIILGVHLLTYATRRRAGMEAREEADRVNDFGRDPIGEGKEEQVRCEGLLYLALSFTMINLRRVTTRS